MKPSPYLARVASLPIELVDLADDVDPYSVDGQVLEGVLDAVGSLLKEDLHRLRTEAEHGQEHAIEVETPTDPDYGRKAR